MLSYWQLKIRGLNLKTKKLEASKMFFRTSIIMTMIASLVTMFLAFGFLVPWPFYKLQQLESEFEVKICSEVSVVQPVWLGQEIICTTFFINITEKMKVYEYEQEYQVSVNNNHNKWYGILALSQNFGGNVDILPLKGTPDFNLKKGDVIKLRFATLTFVSKPPLMFW